MAAAREEGGGKRESQLGRRCEQSECRSRRMTEEESRKKRESAGGRGRLRMEDSWRRRRGTPCTFALAGSFVLAACGVNSLTNKAAFLSG